MNIVNKVRVTICGKDYSLRTDETPEYIAELAARTEKQIYDLIRLKPGFGLQNAAVFVALTSLDEAGKAEKSIEDIRGQIKSSMAEAGRARAAKEKYAARVKELEARIAELEKENKELKKRNPAFDCEQLVLENTISPAVTIYAGDTSGEGKEKSVPAVDDREKLTDTEKSPDGQKSAVSTGAPSGDSPAAGDISPERSAQSDKPAQPTQSNQSSGNSSGDLVSRGREEQKGKETKPEAGGEKGGSSGKTDRPGKALDNDRGGAAASAGNGHSSQDDNLKTGGNVRPGKGGAR